jgi:hypothetical protein
VFGQLSWDLWLQSTSHQHKQQCIHTSRRSLASICLLQLLLGVKPFNLNTSEKLWCQNKPDDLNPYTELNQSPMNVIQVNQNQDHQLNIPSPWLLIQGRHYQHPLPIAAICSTQLRIQSTRYLAPIQHRNIHIPYSDLKFPPAKSWALCLPSCFTSYLM